MIIAPWIKIVRSLATICVNQAPPPFSRYDDSVLAEQQWRPTWRFLAVGDSFDDRSTQLSLALNGIGRIV